MEIELRPTNLKRIKRQTAQLWLRNMPILLQAFGLSGVIAIAAKDPSCSKVEFGVFGHILPWILRIESVNYVIALCGIFYLSVGLMLYFGNYKLKFREIQRKVFQPFLSPTLFLVAGYFLGIAAPLMFSNEYGWALVLSLSILILSTVVNSIYELFEM